MGPQPPYTIDGVIYDTDGATPVSGAEVWCSFKGLKQVRYTNSLGQFSLNLADPEFGGVAYSYGDTVRLWAWNTTYMAFTVHTLADTGVYEWNPTLEKVTHANMMMLAQHIVWKILKDNTTLAHYGVTVVDKEIEFTQRHLENSIVMVMSPETDEHDLTFGDGLRHEDISIEIHLASKHVETGREIVNAIRDAIDDNISRLRNANMWMNQVSVSHSTELDSKALPYIRFIITIDSYWYGA